MSYFCNAILPLFLEEARWRESTHIERDVVMGPLSGWQGIKAAKVHYWCSLLVEAYFYSAIIETSAVEYQDHVRS